RPPPRRRRLAGAPARGTRARRDAAVRGGGRHGARRVAAARGRRGPAPLPRGAARARRDRRRRRRRARGAAGMSRTARRLVALLALGLCLAAAPDRAARAHGRSLSYSSWRLAPD